MSIAGSGAIGQAIMYYEDRPIIPLSRDYGTWQLSGNVVEY